MIDFEKHILDNGLRIIIHKDASTAIAAVNILYDVGARDEHIDKTGFAHLFEHLMFGGSINIPSYDAPLQRVGGENNAFTNNDITNYYVTLPKDNIETAFWLESDRMLGLAFSEKSLEVQRKVVIEEYKQRYLNQPYGDIWLNLRPLAYKKHPYQWATIGKEISHIENANMKDVKDFFHMHYAPNNAIMVVAGNIDTDKVLKLAEKWFGPIPKREIPVRDLAQEVIQTEARTLSLERDVPLDAIYKVWHMGGRNEKDYHATDLISDILANGKSSRLHSKLVKEKKLFNSIEAYISGSADPGLLTISGMLNQGVKPEVGDAAIMDVTEELRNEIVDKDELQKVKNRVEASLTFSELSVLTKAMNLAFHELTDKAESINEEINKYLAVDSKKIQQIANEIISPEKCSTLYYLAKRKSND